MKKIILLTMLAFLLFSCSIDMIEIKNKKQSIRQAKIQRLKFILAKKKNKLKNTKIEIKLTEKDLIILNKELELYSKNIEMNNSYKRMLALDIEKIRSNFLSKNSAKKIKQISAVREGESQTKNSSKISTYNGKMFLYSHNKNIEPGSIYVQIGAFATMEFADDYKAKAIANGFDNTAIIESLYHLVLVGNYDNFNAAYKAKKKLQKLGFSDAYIKKYR